MITLQASGDWTREPVTELIFGHFIEAGFGRQVNGMWSEMLYNRAFRQVPPYYYATWEWLGLTQEHYNSAAPFWHSGYEEHDWEPIGSPELTHTVGTHTFKGRTSLIVANGQAGQTCGLRQAGIHLQEGREYRLSLFAGHRGHISEAGLNGFGDTIHTDAVYPLRVSVGDQVFTAELTTVCAQYDWTFTARRTEIATLSLEFDWEGGLVLAWSSMMPTDNLDGWRRDVVENLRQVAPAVVRFPGGCFVSFYDWESSIGDRNTREPMPSFYWGGLEDNDVGLDEFLSLSRLVGFAPQICFNMMSSTPFKARQLVEYLNAPADVGMGRLRRLNGHTKPYGVRLFEMDNEPGRKWTAKQYAQQCVAFAEEMRLADPGIQLMFAAYNYAPETLGAMLEIAGEHIDYVIYRQGAPEFVEKVLPVIRDYNQRHGTRVKLVNTEWLASCASIEPFENPEMPTDFRWHAEITNDYSRILSTFQVGWNYALNAAHRLMDYMSYGGEFYLANFNNMCNTWGQNVIEASKDGCFLSCAGQVFAFFRRHFVPCFARATETGDVRIRAQLTRGEDGRERLYIVNHGGEACTVRLPEGNWTFVEGLCAPQRISQATETQNPVQPCYVEARNGEVVLPPLCLVYGERQD